MEALTVVGGAVLAPLFESLLADLRSRQVLNYARKKGVSKELCKWEETLKTIKVVLEKAEEQQRTDASVKVWFNDLQNLAYDVEDILDEVNTKAKVESQAGTSKVQKMIHSSMAKFTFQSTAGIRNISERLQNIKERMEFLKLSVEGSKSRVKDDGTTILTSPVVNEAHVYGRGEDQKKIVDQLKAQVGDGRAAVIPIVGMGGVGKTTLAQLVYNDDTLRFDFRAWVTVGDDFNVLTITKKILRQLGGGDQEDFSSLQAKLKEKLSENKSLVVLDDVWTEDYAKWDLFYKPFEAGTPGSRIIVTTRSINVSLMVSGDDGYLLGELSNDNCLSIVAYHAFGRKNFDEHPHLREVGGEIARKCDGLPLAARALGGVLRGKHNTSFWEELLNSKIWEEKEKSVLPALKLSYYQLPSHLKRCFGYTAIFPKDYEFDKTGLVLLWMGEGFVMNIKDGFLYFHDLLARSFFQKGSSDESLFVMHDLINDLARSVSGNICFNLDEEGEKSCVEVRHSAFTPRRYDFALRFEKYHEMKRLRTFLPLKKGYHGGFFISPTVVDLVIDRLKYLRVLALPYAISELPASINCLKHLRYLDLSYAAIEMLPESLCDISNLKALSLYNCFRLRELPKDFCNLINLKCLDIRGTVRLEEMPVGIGDMKKLLILGKIVVGKSDVARMLELWKIPNLRGRQRISELQNVINVEDVGCWKMEQPEGIDELILEWSDKLDDSRNEKNEENVLSALKPQKNIMKLSIHSYGGGEMPSWIGDPWFDKMKILRLYNCYNVASLPALGQLPSLEELTLEGMNGVKEVGMAFYGNVPSSTDVFPSLKILSIGNMAELYEWSNYGIDEGRGQVFPKLKKLDLTRCPKLEVFIFAYPNLDELEVEGCKEVILRSKSNLQSLTKLKISNISGLESLNGVFLEALVSLQEIEVCDCGELKHLWDDGLNVRLLGCLKNLSVRWCEKLEKLPIWLHSLTSLTYLTVKGCLSLKTFPTRGLPYSVKRVMVWNCDSLESLPEGIIVDNSNRGQMCQIEDLRISGYIALILPSNLDFPASLRCLYISGPLLLRSVQLQNGLSHLTHLWIDYCPNLESLQLQNGLSHLTCLSLEKCPNLESLQLQNGLSHLTSLYLRKCEKLRSLPNHINQFTSLQTLQMDDCPEIASFPEGGLPTNLKQLDICYCDKLESKVMLAESLNSLTCLERLQIKVGVGMDDVHSFPYDSLLLPTSLTSLRLLGFQNLKSITRGIHSLTSLEELFISECPKLQSLPRGGLPPSLGRLQIYKCPILEKQCRKGKGDFWPLVASIPAFQLDDFLPGFPKPERLRK